jgi:hypothetical protein
MGEKSSTSCLIARHLDEKSCDSKQRIRWSYICHFDHKMAYIFEILDISLTLNNPCFKKKCPQYLYTPILSCNIDVILRL